MYTIKKFNDESMVFTRKHGTPPTTAHLSKQQVVDIVNGERMRQGKQPDYRQMPNIRHINGVEIRLCPFALKNGDEIPTDGPHFSGVVS